MFCLIFSDFKLVNWNHVKNLHFQSTGKFLDFNIQQTQTTLAITFAYTVVFENIGVVSIFSIIPEFFTEFCYLYIFFLLKRDNLFVLQFSFQRHLNIWNPFLFLHFFFFWCHPLCVFFLRKDNLLLLLFIFLKTMFQLWNRDRK